MTDRRVDDLTPQNVNFQPLTPLTFLDRSKRVFPDKTAVVYGKDRLTWSEFADRCQQLATALKSTGVEVGSTVSVLCPNSPVMLEAHFGVPLCGGVLNALNWRLDASTIAYILSHSDAKVLIVDREFSELANAALSKIPVDLQPFLIGVDDPYAASGTPIGDITYEDFLSLGQTNHELSPIQNEWQSISLNYTSGTTGAPKGVLYHHRGAYLNALGNTLTLGLDANTRYLWTLPMFHCNGWSHTWAIAAMGGTHVCLRKIDAKEITRLISEEKVTHLCGAPTVLNMLATEFDTLDYTFSQSVRVATGGAPPPSSVIQAMEKMGFSVTHLYGLTETYGPSSVCEVQPDWAALDADARTKLSARQGVRYVTTTDLKVLDVHSGEPVTANGDEIGEICVRSNTLMKGYLNDPASTNTAFASDWFHTGDLAVVHSDGYIEIKDRSKDVIISGGENISSVEVEDVLYRHPDVQDAAVVGKPDSFWGEVPCAFVQLRRGSEADAQAIEDWCRDNLAGFKIPREIVFDDLPKTSTGKIQKFLLRDRVRAGT